MWQAWDDGRLEEEQEAVPWMLEQAAQSEPQWVGSLHWVQAAPAQ